MAEVWGHLWIRIPNSGCTDLRIQLVKLIPRDVLILSKWSRLVNELSLWVCWNPPLRALPTPPQGEAQLPPKELEDRELIGSEGWCLRTLVV